jgi:hypothetical protein
VAHVLYAVKLDPMARLERGPDEVGVLEGERGDYEKGSADTRPVQGVEHQRRPQRIGAVVEGQRGLRGDGLRPNPRRV